MQRLAALMLVLLGSSSMVALSDEGMWLLDDLPKQLLKDKYQFDLRDSWMKNVQLASVRFTNGGSGGFVSPHGLIVTNHHIGVDAIQKLSTAQKNYNQIGFRARTHAEELKCPDMELNVLLEIIDVTNKVDAAVKAVPASEAATARRAILSTIEKESLAESGLRSDVVTLYQGALYHLYRYKKYTDVRLVFAPESDIASFGGDTDNFEYPRHGLDVCFFRAYENNSPMKSEHYFRWSTQGPVEGDLVFVTGHPGTTNRLETVAKLLHRRDFSHPYTLARLRAMEAALTQYGERGPEERRQAATDLHRVANARKAFAGQYQGLLTPEIVTQKITEELKIQTRRHELDSRIPLDEKPPNWMKPWTAIANSQKVLLEIEKPYSLFELGHGSTSELFTIARHIVRLSAEMPKPSAERLREYRDSNLESLKLSLYSPAPIYAPFERAKLTASLTFMAETLGATHPTVMLALGGKNPGARAEELVAKCTLADPAERKRLVDGGVKEVDASTDSMIQFVKAIDSASRALRTRYETEVDEPERQAYAQIAAYRFELFGKNVAPDATFSLRLAFGTVKGYQAEGKAVPFHTTFGGAYELAKRQQHTPPFAMPPRWKDGESKVDPATPFNFVSTADTIGGNSGSPVLNRKGELVGINFDRNRFGLVRNFVYTEVQARHIAVHGLGVLEALKKLYDANDLVNELTGK